MREDRQGPHRAAFEKSRAVLMKTATVCGICGQPIDKSLKAPHPMSAVADHIIPISKGGHPSDINNMQLAHWTCNRQKSDKLYKNEEVKKVLGNRNLPQLINWKLYSPQKP